MREELLRDLRTPPPGRGHGHLRLASRHGQSCRAPDQGRSDRRAYRPHCTEFAVTHDEREHLVQELVGRGRAASGPLDPLLLDETITEIMVNGPSHLYIERAGKIQRVDSYFLNDEHVLRIIDRIITPLGRRIDASSPRVDARLPDGSRVNAVIEPLSLVGPVITVRKFPAKPITVDDMIALRHGEPRDVRLPAGLRRSSTQRLRVRRHRVGQDDDAECPLIVHPRGRAHRHDRGRRGAAAPPDARRPARVSPAEPRGHAARSRSATCCAMPSTCAPTASSSGSVVRERRSTCSRP